MKIGDNKHIAGYSLIAFIEMNIARKFGSIYWKTACLSVNAGVFGGNFGGTDYAAISSAIVSMKDDMTLPDINNSEIGFVPKEDKIQFALGAISGLGKNEVDEVIRNRPYTSFEDFLEKTDLSDKKVATLIKTGMFNSFNSDARQLMFDYTKLLTPRKKKLTTVQIPKIEQYIPKAYEDQVKAYNFHQLLSGRNSVQMNEQIEKEFLAWYQPKLIKFDQSATYFAYENGVFNIDMKLFDKWYNKFISPLKEWLKTEEAIEAEAKIGMQEFWIKNAEGNVQSWYFSTLGFYPEKHELDFTPLKEMFPIVDFSEMKEQPETFINNKGKAVPKPERAIIMGTVIDKNRKGIVYIVTPDDQFVSVRVGKGKFPYYNKKVMKGEGKNRKMIDSSWFDRGTKLMAVGYRRGADFIPNNRNTGYEHTLMKVHGYNDNIQVQSEKLN